MGPIVHWKPPPVSVPDAALVNVTFIPSNFVVVDGWPALGTDVSFKETTL